jgi:hypothetical protein
MRVWYRCADAAHGLGGFVCADGGITCPGDAAKAFGGGADFIMCGGMFAGTDEAAGTTVERNGKKYKQFYGMSSNTAMTKHVLALNLANPDPNPDPDHSMPSNTAMTKHVATAHTMPALLPLHACTLFPPWRVRCVCCRHVGGVAEYRSSEGKTVEVPSKGPVASVVLDLLGGLRCANANPHPHPHPHPHPNPHPHPHPNPIPSPPSSSTCWPGCGAHDGTATHFRRGEPP